MLIYNNLTQQKEEFVPIKPGEIGLYACGLTVYDYCHIGHARLFITFDMVVRYLRARGYKVTYVRNITDIDDKIIKRAVKNKEDFSDLTARFIQAMQEDEAALGIVPPDITPRATEHIEQIITMIQTLVDKGYAYVADNGDVYYDVAKFKDYGQLAHQNLDELQAGARIEINEAKHNPLDFVLWKMSKPSEPSWDSPWGEGRPGWHIECSAMSTNYLGNHFDIHGGGVDLQFPHHQNEIAQAEAAHDEKFVNVWMHMGFVQVDKEKMSKSMGNFFTLREVLKHYNPEVLRMFMLASHYRSPVSYSQENLNNAKAALERFYMALRGLPEVTAEINSEYQQKFYEKMDDDFNTPEALAVLFDITREINRLRESDLESAAKLGFTLKNLGGILGLLQQNPENFLQADVSPEQIAEIDNLITARNQARQNKNWAEADKIRDQLLAQGIELEDSSQGTKWHQL